MRGRREMMAVVGSGLWFDLSLVFIINGGELEPNGPQHLTKNFGVH
jgi:hypothetical protein